MSQLPVAQDVNRENFNVHSTNYAERVMDRKSWKNLTNDDEVVISQIREMTLNKIPLDIIDIGCGTGDRLRHILEVGNINLADISSIKGFDYAEKMILHAKNQTYQGKPLYNELLTADILTIDEIPKGNVVLCLWSILNNLMGNENMALMNFAKICSPNGVIIFDFLTTKSYETLINNEKKLLLMKPELKKFQDKNSFWYARNDETIGHMKLIGVEECNESIKKANLRFKNVSGYDNVSFINQQIINDYDNESIPTYAETKCDVLVCVVTH